MASIKICSRVTTNDDLPLTTSPAHLVHILLYIKGNFYLPSLTGVTLAREQHWTFLWFVRKYSQNCNETVQQSKSSKHGEKSRGRTRSILNQIIWNISTQNTFLLSPFRLCHYWLRAYRILCQVTCPTCPAKILAVCFSLPHYCLQTDARSRQDSLP